MIEHVPCDDRRQFLVVEHVNALRSVSNGRCEQLQPERFCKPGKGDFRRTDGVGTAHAAFGQAHAQAVDEFALTDTVATGGRHHAQDHKLISARRIPAMWVPSETILKGFDERMMRFIEVLWVKLSLIHI